MKIKKKIMSAFFSALLILVMAFPAFAGSTTAVAEYEYCEFSMYTICNPYDFSTFMEFQRIIVPGCGKTYHDYSFKSDVVVYQAGVFNAPIELATIYGTATTNMNVNSGNFTVVLNQVKAFHYVNNSLVTYTVARYEL